MIETPKSDAQDAAAKKLPQAEPATALPDAIRARLAADASTADAAGQLVAPAPVDKLSALPLADTLKALVAAVPSTLAKTYGTARQGAGVLAARRPDLAALRKMQIPQLSPEIRDGIVKHGRRAGINIGTALDSIVRSRPKAPASDAAAVADADPLTTDIRTVALQRAVRQPSIFAPGHIITALLAGGIIHIATTFAITSLGTGSAFRQLRGALPANTMVLLPPQTPGAQLLPFLMPDMLYAICRFDLTGGAVEVNAVLPEIGWSLALYTRQGDNFYATPGQSQRPVRAAFMLAPTTDRLINLTPGARKTDVDMSQVTSPDSEGLIVVRAPLKGVAFEGTARADLMRASCAPSRR